MAYQKKDIKALENFIPANCFDDILIQSIPLLECFVQGKLTDLRSHSGLSQVHDSLINLFDVVRCFFRVDDLYI